MKNFQSFITEENVNDGDIQIAVITKVSSNKEETNSKNIQIKIKFHVTLSIHKRHGCQIMI